MSAKKFSLGDRVRFTHVASNPYDDKTIKNYGKNVHLSIFAPFTGKTDKWEGVRKVIAVELTKPMDGIVVGRKFLSEGVRSWETDGDEYEQRIYATWYQTGRKIVYLIATSLTSQHFRVLPDHLEKITS